jgi:formylglycine-generating enzyme required for sulfatase activity
MIEIPAGCFDMGDALGEGMPNELPVHNVCISAFEMDVHEVTNAEYAECVGAGGCTAPYLTDSLHRETYYGDPTWDDFPVITVDWFQAYNYCAWAGKRLPTEAEWEYAARGGLAGKRYPWGDTVSGTDANYGDSGDPWDNDTSQVTYHAPNGYGLYDMAGNVTEWVNDWFQSGYYSVSPENDPPGPASGEEDEQQREQRVMRGGSFFYNSYYLRVADRGYDAPSAFFYDIGIRCAR